MPAVQTVQAKRFAAPDDVRLFEGRGRAEMVLVAGRLVGRGVFEPGWRWSVNAKPLAGTDSCQATHFGYCVSGRMRIEMDDGSTLEIGPEQVFMIPPGHDAQVLGDEPCVLIDFGDIEDYARRS